MIELYNYYQYGILLIECYHYILYMAERIIMIYHRIMSALLLGIGFMVEAGELEKARPTIFNHLKDVMNDHKAAILDEQYGMYNLSDATTKSLRNKWDTFLSLEHDCKYYERNENLILDMRKVDVFGKTYYSTPTSAKISIYALGFLTGVAATLMYNHYIQH
jgi:hypothetical protein